MRKLAEESFVVEFVKRIRKKAPGIGGGKLWRMYANEFLRSTALKCVNADAVPKRPIPRMVFQPTGTS